MRKRRGCASVQILGEFIRERENSFNLGYFQVLDRNEVVF
jgi:hypothetical protein